MIQVFHNFQVMVSHSVEHLILVLSTLVITHKNSETYLMLYKMVQNLVWFELIEDVNILQDQLYHHYMLVNHVLLWLKILIFLPSRVVRQERDVTAALHPHNISHHPQPLTSSRSEGIDKMWKFFGISLLICLICLIQYRLLFFPSFSFTPSLPTSHLLRHGEQETKVHRSVPLKIAILLQISPVDQPHRIHRLVAIDKGWALWQYSNFVNSPTIHLYAPSPHMGHHDFHNIRMIQVTGTDPFQRLVEGLFSLILPHTSVKYDWFLVGNDHTFLIPSNLVCFLNKLDKSDLIYTGNQLHVPFHGKLLRFASGGAGAVLSRPALVSILAIWTLLHPPLVREILQRFRIMPPSNDLIPPYSLQNITLNTVNGTLSDFQVFFILLRWADNSSSEANIRRITIILSSTKCLTLTLDFLSQVLRVSAEYVEKSSSKLTSSQVLRQFCSCSTLWDHDNPGIILAACLQEVFGVTFTAARSSKDSSQEIFNVYGLVRMVLNDFDPWYNEMKSLEKLNPKAESQLMPDTISLHYVSQNESSLLYEMLSNHCLVHNAEINPETLLQLWPSASLDIGHYSRKIKNVYEANLTYNYLCHRLFLMQSDCSLPS